MYQLRTKLLKFVSMYQLRTKLLKFVSTYQLRTKLLKFVSMYQLRTKLLKFVSMYHLRTKLLKFVSMYQLRTKFNTNNEYFTLQPTCILCATPVCVTKYLLGWKLFQTEFVEGKTHLNQYTCSKSPSSFEKHIQKLQNIPEL